MTPRSPLPRWSLYGLALAGTLAVLLVRAELIPLVANRPLLILLVLPITLSAGLGGLGPGLLATLVAAVGADLLILDPPGFGIAYPMDAVQLGILTAAGVLVSVLAEGLHRARRQAEEGRALVAYGLLLRVLSERLQRAERGEAQGRALQTAILASIGDGVIATDAQGLVCSLNAQAERLTGWRDADAAGRSVAEVLPIIHAETRAPVAEPVPRVLATGECLGLAGDTLLMTRDGLELPIHGSAAPVRGGDGTFLGVVLVFRDAPSAPAGRALGA